MVDGQAGALHTAVGAFDPVLDSMGHKDRVSSFEVACVVIQAGFEETEPAQIISDDAQQTRACRAFGAQGSEELTFDRQPSGRCPCLRGSGFEGCFVS